MRYPWVNVALLVLLVAQLATGFAGLIAGAPGFAWVLWLHSAGAYAVLILLVWKGAVIYGALFKRRRRLSTARLAFLVLLVLLLAILATGFVWTYAGRESVVGLSLMTIHALLALALVGLTAWHVLARRFVFRVAPARDRRAFLRLVGASLAGLAVWRLGGTVQAVLDLPGVGRRFTGSYEEGSLTGDFPAVSWLLDDPRPVDVARWRLVIEGAVGRPRVLTYAELTQLATESLDVILDCTGGWYSRQVWTGVRLGRLLDAAGVQAGAQSVTVEAVSGYGRRLSLSDARDCLLATAVAGAPLAHGHGFPLRLVAPNHRGFDWVKWVARIRVNETSELLQPPVPLH